MSNLAEKVKFTEDGRKVILPKRLWDEIMEALENGKLLNEIEELKGEFAERQKTARKWPAPRPLGINEFGRGDLCK